MYYICKTKLHIVLSEDGDIKFSCILSDLQFLFTKLMLQELLLR